MLSLDRAILAKDSAVQKRLVALAGRHGSDTDKEHGTEAEVVDMVVLVPGERDGEEKLSEHLTVYSFGGPKWLQLWKMWRGGKQLLTFSSSLLTTPDLITVQDVYFLGFLAAKLDTFYFSKRMAVHI